MPTSAPELTQPSELRLFTARGQTVVLDSDLARLYGVSTKVFNQAIRRNNTRFPSDFLFRLTPEEWAGLRSQIVTLKPAGRGEHRKYRPLAFTEHGAIMAGKSALAKPRHRSPCAMSDSTLQSPNRLTVLPLPGLHLDSLGVCLSALGLLSLCSQRWDFVRGG